MPLCNPSVLTYFIPSQQAAVTTGILLHCICLSIAMTSQNLPDTQHGRAWLKEGMQK